MKGKTTQYLKYAFGEIILVMIGILLALQVNNWNEDRKLKTQLNTILKTIKEDLKTDTIVVSGIVQFYDTINKYSHKYINKEINVENIDSFPICRSLITLYQPMTIQKKGYKLLENYSQVTTNKSDSLYIDIGQFYALYESTIENNNDMIKTEVLNNLEFFKKQPWFLDWSQGRVTEEIRAYFGESMDYRNRVVGNNILATSNHQAILKRYKNDVTELLTLINNRLEPSE
ncbi:DUF6090 family protein [Winogradskyella sp. 3972H.M.0a.05]|uniref:DUF6090 family protein n=1 Tax=Winogradskyella sp. 3972H.M.0a.05 TaxID=2950277 RepID=UPI003398A012